MQGVGIMPVIHASPRDQQPESKKTCDPTAETNTNEQKARTETSPNRHMKMIQSLLGLSNLH